MNAKTPHEYLAEPDLLLSPVWSQEAEQSVLGALLIDNRAFDAVAGVLQAGCFWHAAHRTIWGAITAQIAAGKPADAITVHDALGAAAADVGGLAYLNSLACSVVSASNIRRYADIVAERAAQRETIAAADRALAIARETGITTADRLDRIAVEFAAINRGQMRQEPRRMADLMLAAIDRYSALADGKADPAWRTGIAPLDRLLKGGLRPGKVYTIAARPSVGKSSAARTIAIETAMSGLPALLLSQEMPADEVTDCIVSELGGIDNGNLQTGKLTDDEWSRLTEAAEDASRLPLHIDDEGGLTIGQIRAKARAVKGLKVLLVDYLQLSTSTLKGASTNDQVAEISKGLKQLALQLGIAVVVLSQLNREVEKRVDKEPQLSDLRDSGAIEQDADAVIMLWTAMEPSGGDSSRLVGWKVAKHRGGKTGVFAMRFEGAIYRWRESAEPLRRSSGKSSERGFE